MALDRAAVVWKPTIKLEAGQRYRFRYLIDGKEWLNDWYADDHVENTYGSYDSVVDLTRLPKSAYSDEIDHVFRPCRPAVGAKRR